jgi:hypothetical protein
MFIRQGKNMSGNAAVPGRKQGTLTFHFKQGWIIPENSLKNGFSHKPGFVPDLMLPAELIYRSFFPVVKEQSMPVATFQVYVFVLFSVHWLDKLINNIRSSGL